MGGSIPFHSASNHKCHTLLPDVWSGDATVLLKSERSNKLLTNFRLSPFKVVQETGTEVTVRNEAGEEFRRNTAFVKKYEQDGVSRANGEESNL